MASGFFSETEAMGENRESHFGHTAQRACENVTVEDDYFQ